jgi:XapX domain-containing protein
MKAYLVSLAAGVVVGLLYSAMEVKSPAPPTVALVGLLGMLAGEHVIPLVRGWLATGIH